MKKYHYAHHPFWGWAALSVCFLCLSSQGAKAADATTKGNPSLTGKIIFHKFSRCFV